MLFLLGGCYYVVGQQMKPLVVALDSFEASFVEKNVELEHDMTELMDILHDGMKELKDDLKRIELRDASNMQELRDLLASFGKADENKDVELE